MLDKASETFVHSGGRRLSFSLTEASPLPQMRREQQILSGPVLDFTSSAAHQAFSQCDADSPENRRRTGPRTSKDATVQGPRLTAPRSHHRSVEEPVCVFRVCGHPDQWIADPCVTQECVCACVCVPGGSAGTGPGSAAPGHTLAFAASHTLLSGPAGQRSEVSSSLMLATEEQPTFWMRSAWTTWLAT